MIIYDKYKKNIKIIIYKSREQRKKKRKYMHGRNALILNTTRLLSSESFFLLFTANLQSTVSHVRINNIICEYITGN